MKKLSEKGIIHIVSLLVVLAIAAVAVWFLLNEGKLLFFENKDGLGPSGMKVQIDPSQLMPLVSAKEARITICNLKKEELFAQVCQSKYDTVSKEDGEKIVELFALIEKIKNDKSISDYDRLLLSQAVFAALPIGDNPEDSESHNLNQQPLLSLLKDYLTGQITIYAQGQIMSEEEFKELMKNDLQNMIDNMPKGDNAWVMNVMVSKYSWIDGERQPIYSRQWGKAFDPFPDNPKVDPRNITYHIQARVGSRSSSQTVDVGRPSYKGTSEMIAYSFTIESWKSQEYADGRGPTLDDFHLSQLNFSDEDYKGEDYITKLIMSVKTPRPEVLTQNFDKDEPKDEQIDQNSTDDIIDICETPERFCEAVEQCAEIGMSEGDRELTYGERYAYCKKNNEGYFNDTCRLLVWMQESYSCPLGDNSCEARGKQAAAALKIPECKPTTR